MSYPVNRSQPYPVLGAVTAWANTLGLPPMGNILFVCVQHLLNTTDCMFDELFLLGVNPKNVHILGKSYSSCESVIDKFIAKGCHYYPNTLQLKSGEFSTIFAQDVQKMWQSVQRELCYHKPDMIVVLDDGGSCLTSVPNEILTQFKIVGVEQTSSGRRNVLLNEIVFPVVDVASSAAKQLIESPMIAATVTEKIHLALPAHGNGASCLVVGLGVIGQAVTKKLLNLGFTVFTFDDDPSKNRVFDGASKVNFLAEAIQSMDYIFGCAGRDITADINLEDISTNKTFISCSSQDKEFLTLLRYIAEKEVTKKNILEDIEFYTKKGIKIQVCRGGFPVNFDRSAESVVGRDIQLTRGLLLGGVIQAITLGNDNQYKHHVYMLEPSIQKMVVDVWRQSGSAHLIESALLTQFQNIEWIKQNSGSFYCLNAKLVMPEFTY